MRYLQKDDYRVLTAIEMGMRNHELVPVELIVTIAQLRHGGSHKILSTLLRYKLIAHAQQEYNGYRLSYLGYDILALRTLLSRGIITSVGSQIGVGKESDIFEALNSDGNEIVIKIHRLGRTSFRSVRKNRDYLSGKSKVSWLYLSRLAAIKEFAFMRALHAHGFPTPTPIDQNRHCVVMSRVDGFPMAQIKTGKMNCADVIFERCTAILKRLAEHGLVHCDFNEFNLMVNDNGDITLIDFPQMVSITHPNAADLFLRDFNCLVKFFSMKMCYVPPPELVFTLEDVTRLNAAGTNIHGEVSERISADVGMNLTPLESALLSGYIHGSGDAELDSDGSDSTVEHSGGSDEIEDGGEIDGGDNSDPPIDATAVVCDPPPLVTYDMKKTR